MKYTILIFIAAFLFSACNDDGYKKKRIGNDIIEAKFIDDSLIDGLAKFYDLEGKLIAKYNYVKGLREGSAVTYHDNGKVKDSMNYTNNLLNGNAYRYDLDGKLLLMRTNYYGLDIGDHFIYNHGKIQKYHFDNFEKTQLIRCEYDSLGSCESLFFNAKPLTTSALMDNRYPVLGLFLYFPHPPDFEITYKMGLIDNKENKQNEFILNSNRLFLDTILSFPPSNLGYYLSVDYKNLSNDSVVNVLFQKL